MNKAFGCEWLSDEVMLAALSQDVDGLLTHLVHVAEGRQRAQPLWDELGDQAEYVWDVDFRAEGDMTDVPAASQDSGEIVEVGSGVAAPAASQGNGETAQPFLHIARRNSVADALLAQICNRSSQRRWRIS